MGRPRSRGVEQCWTLMEKGGGRSKKLDNFHGRHMWIVCKLENTAGYTILNQTAPDGFSHLRNVEYGSINSRE